MRPTRRNSIYIEGVNGSGKSSVARRLQDRLMDRGAEVISKHGDLVVNPTGTRLTQEAFASLEGNRSASWPDKSFMTEFNIYMSAKIIVDSTLFDHALKKDHASALILDRHWFSQHLLNSFFTPNLLALSPSWIASCAPRLSAQFYLTCRPETRWARIAQRPRRLGHPLNDYLCQSPSRLAELDEFALDLLDSNDGWIVLQTDCRSIDQVADEILAIWQAETRRGPN